MSAFIVIHSHHWSPISLQINILKPWVWLYGWHHPVYLVPEMSDIWTTWSSWEGYGLLGLYSDWIWLRTWGGAVLAIVNDSVYVRKHILLYCLFYCEGGQNIQKELFSKAYIIYYQTYFCNQWSCLLLAVRRNASIFRPRSSVNLSYCLYCEHVSMLTLAFNTKYSLTEMLARLYTLSQSCFKCRLLNNQYLVLNLDFPVKMEKPLKKRLDLNGSLIQASLLKPWPMTFVKHLFQSEWLTRGTLICLTFIQNRLTKKWLVNLGNKRKFVKEQLQSMVLDFKPFY